MSKTKNELSQMIPKAEGSEQFANNPVILT
jgi:hypothetical protein